MSAKVVTFVLAGGAGNRLLPLTEDSAKPAVPFGGKYRIIDFALSNLINSGLCAIYVLVQYRSHSLLRHLRDGWQFGGLLQEQFIIPVPAQMRTEDDSWYRGTADAIFQNLSLLDVPDDGLVAIFSADHIYRMNVQHMIEFHERMHADVTVAAVPVPHELATAFGVIEADEGGTIHGFHEKSDRAPSIPGHPGMIYASMGNYIFSARALYRELHADAQRPNSRHDFGRDILPGMLGSTNMRAYDFQTNVIPGEPAPAPAYWRDVGTLDAYYEAQKDLCGVVPSLNLYNPNWPIRTASYPDPSAKFTFDKEGCPGQATGSIISGGCILSGGSVSGSVLGRGVRIHSEAVVEDSILFDNCTVGAKSRIRRAILDEGVQVPEGMSIGFDPIADASRYHVTEAGVAVVRKRAFERKGKD
ncbi:MAG TPA: glucose-1-phosphate adenylyltransferase [Terracidiphilus sp.]|nr:glucose-1-phosphate adenylyltransferase [Terracidiphilus sp.]HEV2464346.1 glucose-1-phosphate adenylyltransferase [Acidobacteriaceae bacterium]